MHRELADVVPERHECAMGLGVVALVGRPVVQIIARLAGPHGRPLADYANLSSISSRVAARALVILSTRAWV